MTTSKALATDGGTDEIHVRPPRLWQWMLTPKRAQAQDDLWLEQTRRRINEQILDRQIREARKNVSRLEDLLQPGRRLEWSEELAYWQANLDSLEEDGVYAIAKGRE